jgi:Uma2 family endonuclease
MQRKIAPMVPPPELIEAPLTRDELGARYRALCDDPLYAKVPGKIELDVWGRMVMTPPSYYHGVIQGRLVYKLTTALGGQASVEAPIVTPAGLLLADVAWASPQFVSVHGRQTPLMRAPEICIEVVSPSNFVKELQEKRIAYLAAGANEVWIVYPQSKRFEFHGADGHISQSAYAVELAGIFD